MLVNKPEISILLPSLRPSASSRTIQEFAETNSNCNYEIILVSPFEIQANKVRWIKEEISSGSVEATNIAYRWASSPYVVYFSDDVSPTYNCLNNMLEFMRNNRKNTLGAFKMIRPNSNSEIGPFGAYGKFYACYGCISKEYANILGGLFNPSLLYSWADIDLSLRVYNTEGQVLKCHTASVIPRQIEDKVYIEHRQKYWEKDVNTFLDLWHDKLGKHLPRIDGEVNKKIC